MALNNENYQTVAATNTFVHELPKVQETASSPPSPTTGSGTCR